MKQKNMKPLKNEHILRVTVFGIAADSLKCCVSASLCAMNILCGATHRDVVQHIAQKSTKHVLKHDRTFTLDYIKKTNLLKESTDPAIYGSAEERNYLKCWKTNV